MTTDVYARSGRNPRDLQAGTLFCGGVANVALQNLVANDPTQATHNTTLINNALTNSQVVNLPQGNFYINGQITIGNNGGVLNGVGMDQTTLTLATGTNNVAMIKVIGGSGVISDCQVSNLTLSGNAPYNTGCFGVYCYGAFASLVQRVHCYNINGHSFYFDGTSGLQSSICYCDHCVSEYPVGSHVVHTSNSQDCVAQYCYCQYSAGQGFDLSGFGSKISHCHSYRGLQNGVVLESFGGRNEVSKCVLDTQQQWGLVVSGSKENIIDGNLFFNEDLSNGSHGAISCITGTDGFGARNIIVNNVIYDDGASITSFTGVNGLVYGGRSAGVSTTNGISISNGCLGNMVNNNSVTSQIPNRYIGGSGNLIIDNEPLGIFAKQYQGIIQGAQGFTTQTSNTPYASNAYFSGSTWINVNTTPDYSSAIVSTSTGTLNIQLTAISGAALSFNTGSAITFQTAMSIDKNITTSFGGNVFCASGTRFGIATIGTSAVVPNNTPTLYITGTLGNIQLLLPSVASCPGAEIRVLKRDGANTTTFTTTGTDSSLIPVLSQSTGCVIMNDGAGTWYQI